jgi:hypothetical protein
LVRGNIRGNNLQNSRDVAAGPHIVTSSPDTPPLGARFSHVYLDRGKPRQDSARMRRRLAALVFSLEDLNLFSAVVPRELGIDVPWVPGGGSNWAAFFKNCELQDVLDLITVAFHYLVRLRGTGMRDLDANIRWVREVRRIFAEENLHYTVDDRGGVHFQFDEEFARNHAAAIGALQSSRYANALHAFENGMAALSHGPPDGKGAIRAVFGAAENIFRLVLPRAPRLAADQIDGLTPLLQQLYPQDETARRSVTKLLGSLKDWVNAAHFYRHEQGVEDVVAQPPLTLAVYIVSTGVAHVRWLAELDHHLTQTRE